MTNIECKTNDLLPNNQFLNDLGNNNINNESSIESTNNLSNEITDSENINKNVNLEYSNLQIKKIIDEFTEDQQIEIFKIIKYYDQYYSSNNNGVFINLDSLSNECKNDIIKFINFSKYNNICLDKMEMDVDKYKQIIDDSNSENN